ncbi:MAG: ribosome-associated translation inhibitor RaiA [Coxiellaceae bacterium]|nr:MAG: ribosome-associated translation inhibitor RaiA [Coxiellaceae bacterium]
MLVPIQITIRDIPNSGAIESKIQQKANKLSRYCDRINSCRVVVEVPQKHKHQGKLYTVRIDLTVPGKELVVNRVTNEDLYVAIRDAFNAARRQLSNYTHRLRGDIKVHHEPMRGKIIRIFPEQGYGFIVTPEGVEYYFHEMNVMQPTFAELHVGKWVEFLEIVAGDGLQAAQVKSLEH